MQLSIDFDYNDFFAVPGIKISIESLCLYDGQVNEHFEFDIDLEDGAHQLTIQHHGKKIDWTTNDQDHHVLITKICFDQIDLDQIDYCKLTHLGRFYPEYEPSYQASCQANGLELPEFICPNHYLGHNGCWKLDFESPGLLWIIKQQNPSGMHLEDTIFSTSGHVLQEIKDFFKLNV